MSKSRPKTGLAKWSVFGWAAITAALLWAAFPPLAWWPLGWLAPLAWLHLIAREPGIRALHQTQSSALRPAGWPARGGYFQVWLAGLVYWAGTCYFIPIPHPALWACWVAMSLYLALYWPLGMAAARVMRHAWHWPLPLAAAVSWVGMELARGYLFSGFSMALLGHVPYKLPLMIQIADLGGAYAVSFAMVLWAGLVYQAARSGAWRGRLGWSSGAVVLVALAIGYGVWRQQSIDARQPSAPRFPVAIVQGSIDTIFPTTQAENNEFNKREFTEYRRLVMEARRRFPNAAVLLIPEGKFPGIDVLKSSDAAAPPLDADRSELAARLREDLVILYRAFVGKVPSPLDNMPDERLFNDGVQLLAGGQSWIPADGRAFNSALLIDAGGRVVDRYLKNHLVMFGEYVPLADVFPFLARLTPIGDGMSAGKAPRAIMIDGRRFSPSICFESTVPHLIRRHVNELTRAGQPPDVLVNLTNDGWFYGTSCLDLHLASNVMRAVEMRLPMLVAANTGLSAYIDSAGRIVEQGPRRQTAVLGVDVVFDGTDSLYRRIGDWPALVALAAVLAALGHAAARRVLRSRKK